MLGIEADNERTQIIERVEQPRRGPARLMANTHELGGVALQRCGQGFPLVLGCMPFQTSLPCSSSTWTAVSLSATSNAA
ncbi:hypothetical protein AEGHOMDF_5579 [Methylobacterium soli]|nr:hypothetical protein AEGHOMDF_5579 [Methylobacterium soli]